ncbi:SDR family NAD(P)-dependent oxidoreductase [Ferrimicrobium sp.]|uniref:SDR family NAD(P)-dependent oxidoreductase n=1 Tax=Ferrimicrobium sp. TaxID=2926050 RepID=UPI0026161DF5|nr:SDR family NAD(P)-dependent oxidoreductase [Ferrimicrobium sp.]
MNRHVIVTGASRGLGRAVVTRMAQDGWRVSFGARNLQELEALERELTTMGFASAFHQLDVSLPASVSGFFDWSIKTFGPPAAVVHSAGIYGPFGNSQNVDPAVWYQTIAINLGGSFLVAREAIGAMLRGGGGKIVMLSGGGATSPMPNISAYAASKAGVVRLVESLALEVESDGIVVNAVAPGLMATDMLDELLAQSREVIGPSFYDRMIDAKQRGEDSLPEAVDLVAFLASTTVPGLTGRLISAKWDPWRGWDGEVPELEDRNAFTLRRIVPETGNPS